MDQTRSVFAPIDDRPLHLYCSTYGLPSPPEHLQHSWKIIHGFLTHDEPAINSTEDAVRTTARKDEAVTSPASNADTAAALAVASEVTHPVDELLASLPSNPMLTIGQIHVYTSSIFSNILELARQIPPHHLYRWRLVSLLCDLSRQPGPTDFAIPSLTRQTSSLKSVPATSVSTLYADYSGDGSLQWSRLPTLAFLLWDSFDGRGIWAGRGYPRSHDGQVRSHHLQQPEDPSETDGRWTPDENLNMNAFAALVLVGLSHIPDSLALPAMGLQDLGFKVLENMLELSDGRPVAIHRTRALEVGISAGAMWILTAGQFLRESGLASDSQPQSSGVIWGRARTAFEQAQIDTNLTESTRNWAQRARKHMGEVDGMQTGADVDPLVEHPA